MHQHTIEFEDDKPFDFSDDKSLNSCEIHQLIRRGLQENKEVVLQIGGNRRVINHIDFHHPDIKVNPHWYVWLD